MKALSEALIKLHLELDWCFW